MLKYMYMYVCVYTILSSRFFAKELFYRITTQSSEPNVNYLDLEQ